MSMEAGRTIPKFGQWDVNNPASADGFTVIFSKARDEKKAPVTNVHKINRSTDSKDGRTEKMNSYNNNNSRANTSKKWFCCVSPSPTQP
ncbi:protein NOI4-like isoform X1 [Lolium perenne]|uniref:protein NOI4-like isoform X1 n=1 Tax=Lolium perenne TaxID=4522 RepID=UPI0021F579EC|nr:protein NOI4-like isoform X1 [Lolium perenne]